MTDFRMTPKDIFSEKGFKYNGLLKMTKEIAKLKKYIPDTIQAMAETQFMNAHAGNIS